MKNNIICLLICLCLSSCIKAKEKDYSYLKIQTELTEKETKYYESIHNQVSDIGKVFAFNPELDETTLNNSCLKLKKIFEDLSTHLISRERERERESENLCTVSVIIFTKRKICRVNGRFTLWQN
jgi:hypothetical protein